MVTNKMQSKLVMILLLIACLASTECGPTE